MKKKVINVIFGVPLLLLGSTFLFIQNYFIGIILLTIACITFCYITTSNDTNIKTRIRNVIIAYLLVFIIYAIVYFVVGLVDDYKNKKIFEEDISKCYVILSEEHNYKEFEGLIEKHKKLYDNYEKEAYSILEKAIDDKIEQAKTGTIDDEFLQMLNNLKIDNYEIEKRMQTKTKTLKEYNVIVEINNYIENKDYIKANSELNNLLYDCENEEVKKIATSKQNEIKDLLIEEVISKAQEEISKKDYTSAKAILSNYKNLNDEKINNLYSIVTEEISKIEQAKIEKERFDYEVYCYFNLIAWKEKDTITDDKAYSKCATKFGITKEQAKESYNNVKNIGWKYQDKYPDIFEKYASQY